MRSWRQPDDSFRPMAGTRRGSDASDTSIAPSTASAATSGTRASLSRKLLGSFAAVQAAPEPLPAGAHKDPLSLVITTKNFRAFVAKAGPLFWFQDHVEATFLWDDWAWTAMWMAIWAAISLRPSLLLAAPPAILTFILYKTHRARFPHAYAHSSLRLSSPTEALTSLLEKPTKLHDDHPLPPLTPTPAQEGSMQFLQNLRDIQNMMKMIPDTYDAISHFVPYLNWSNPTVSLLLLQGSILATLLMFFVAPLLPLRMIMLVGGEVAIIKNHPWVQPFIHGLSHPDLIDSNEKDTLPAKAANKIQAARQVLREKGVELAHTAQTWMELDQLPDEAWSQGWAEVEMFENERFGSPSSTSSGGTGVLPKNGEWGGAHLSPHDRRPWTRSQDGWSPPLLDSTSTQYSEGVNAWRVAAALPRGWEWIPSDDWRVDNVGAWSSVGTDEYGWVYSDDAWHWSAPYAYGHPGQPTEALNPSEAQATLALAQAQEGHDDDASPSTWAHAQARVDGSDFPLAALGKHGPAVTRRRRWLRRCVRVSTHPIH